MSYFEYVFSSGQNTMELNNLFSLVLLDKILNMDVLSCDKSKLETSNLSGKNPARFEDHMPAAQSLTLPEEVKFQVRKYKQNNDLNYLNIL